MERGTRHTQVFGGLATVGTTRLEVAMRVVRERGAEREGSERVLLNRKQASSMSAWLLVVDKKGRSNSK